MSGAASYDDREGIDYAEIEIARSAIPGVIDNFIKVVGEKEYSKFARAFVLARKDYLLAVGKPDSPSVILLKQILAEQEREERGFE